MLCQPGIMRQTSANILLEGALRALWQAPVVLIYGIANRVEMIEQSQPMLRIVCSLIAFLRQRLAHRNQVPHFPCFPSMELGVRGCIWQKALQLQVGPLQPAGVLNSAYKLLTSCRSVTKLDCRLPGNSWTMSTNKVAAQWRDTPKSRT